MAEFDEVRAVVVRLADRTYNERPWIACVMSAGSYDVIGEDDWQKWRNEALPMVLADWEQYEVREVFIRIPQDQLDALYAVESIEGEVVNDG